LRTNYIGLQVNEREATIAAEMVLQNSTS